MTENTSEGQTFAPLAPLHLSPTIVENLQVERVCKRRNDEAAFGITHNTISSEQIRDGFVIGPAYYHPEPIQ